MRLFAGVLGLALLAGCTAQEQKNAEKAAADAARKASDELTRAKDALLQEARQDLDTAKRDAASVSASLTKLDDNAAALYQEALDDLQKSGDAAAARLTEAGEAGDHAWHALGKEAREDAAKVRKAAGRIAALAGDVKDDFAREADAMLAETRSEIDAVKAKSAPLEEKARRANERLTAALERDWEAAKRSLAKAKAAKDERWKDVRHDVNRDLHKVRAALRAAREELDKG